MSDVIQIHMQSFEVCCAVCAQPCSKGYGVPMYEGLLVSTSWTGPWAGMPACFECYGKHGRGELETFDDSLEVPTVEVERAADVEAFVRTLADDLSAAAPEGVRWAIVVQTGPEEAVRVAVHNAGSAGGVEELVRRLGIAMANPAAAADAFGGDDADTAPLLQRIARLLSRIPDGWFVDLALATEAMGVKEEIAAALNSPSPTGRASRGGEEG